MKIVNFWKPALWLIIICYLSLMPGDGLPRVPLFNIPHFDKLVHFGFYFIFTLLLIRPFSGISRFSFMISAMLAATVSGVIEILQFQIAIHRHGDLFDFLANLAGVLTALLFFRIIISGKKAERFL